MEQELDKLNPRKGTATNAMALFLSINTTGVTILPTETVFYAMVRDAQAPSFRAFTELVKRG